MTPELWVYFAVVVVTHLWLVAFVGGLVWHLSRREQRIAWKEEAAHEKLQEADPDLARELGPHPAESDQPPATS